MSQFLADLHTTANDFFFDGDAYREYMRSPRWRLMKEGIRERYGDICEVCNSPKKITIHHNTYKRLQKELDGDLTVLCNSCHFTFHRLQRYPYRWNSSPGQKVCHLCHGNKNIHTLSSGKDFKRNLHLCDRCFNHFEVKITRKEITSVDTTINRSSQPQAFSKKKRRSVREMCAGRSLSDGGWVPISIEEEKKKKKRKRKKKRAKA